MKVLVFLAALSPQQLDLLIEVLEEYDEALQTEIYCATHRCRYAIQDSNSQESKGNNSLSSSYLYRPIGSRRWPSTRMAQEARRGSLGTAKALGVERIGDRTTPLVFPVSVLPTEEVQPMAKEVGNRGYEGSRAI